MEKRSLFALLLGALPHIAMAQSPTRPSAPRTIPAIAGAEAAPAEQATPRAAPATTEADDQRRSDRSGNTYYRITTLWANNQIRPGWQR